MKLAGPAAMMEVLLLTNRPAPMIPPIEIMVRWRGFKERDSSFFPGVSTGFERVINGTSVDGRGILPCFHIDTGVPQRGTRGAAPQLAFANPRKGICRVRTVEFPRQPVGIPEC